jgi:hypothetical protein
MTMFRYIKNIVCAIVMLAMCGMVSAEVNLNMQAAAGVDSF